MAQEFNMKELSAPRTSVGNNEARVRGVQGRKMRQFYAGVWEIGGRQVEVIYTANYLSIDIDLV